MDDINAEKQLNRLLHRNYDAEKGYKQAMEKVKDPDLQVVFKNNSEERYRYGHEIKEIMAELKMKPDKGSTIEADVHRAWMNLKDLFSLNSEKAILEEAERGEEYAIEDYENAVQNPSLSPQQRSMLSAHLSSIKDSKQQLETMETLLKS